MKMKIKKKAKKDKKIRIKRVSGREQFGEIQKSFNEMMNTMDTLVTQYLSFRLALYCGEWQEVITK
jgi:methyl-accepting chemotaxis protein